MLLTLSRVGLQAALDIAANHLPLSLTPKARPL